MICEGSTDGVLLQYFMRRVHQWEDVHKKEKLFKDYASWFRRLEKDSDQLDIVACKGSSTLLSCMESVLEFNENANSVDEAYDKIVIVTDRDEYSTEEEFVSEIKQLLLNKNCILKESLTHNEWTLCEYTSSNNRIREFELLLLVIPFEDYGAMETFLLNSISRKDPYDAKIIEQGNQFVDTVDDEKRYLTQRRYITKAKFDVYFSIRTSATQFNQRQDILKGVNWEEYIDIQGEFKKLEHLNG